MWLAHSPRPACLPNAAEHEYDALRIAIPLYMLRGELSQSEDSDENSFIESAWTGDRLRRTELVECSVERADTEPAKDISEPILDRDSFLIPFFKIFNLFRREDVVLVVCCGCKFLDQAHDHCQSPGSSRTAHIDVLARCIAQ